MRIVYVVDENVTTSGVTIPSYNVNYELGSFPYRMMLMNLGFDESTTTHYIYSNTSAIT